MTIRPLDKTPFDQRVHDFVAEISTHSLYIDESGDWVQTSALTRAIRWLFSWIPFSSYVMDSTVDRCNRVSLSYIEQQTTRADEAGKYEMLIRILENGERRPFLITIDTAYTKQVFTEALRPLLAVYHPGEVRNKINMVDVGDVYAHNGSLDRMIRNIDAGFKEQSNRDIDAAKNAAEAEQKKLADTHAGIVGHRDLTIKGLNDEIAKLKNEIAELKRTVEADVKADKTGKAAVPPAQTVNAPTAEADTKLIAEKELHIASLSEQIVKLEAEVKRQIDLNGTLKVDFQKAATDSNVAKTTAVAEKVAALKAEHDKQIEEINKKHNGMVATVRSGLETTIRKHQTELTAKEERIKLLESTALSTRTQHSKALSERDAEIKGLKAAAAKVPEETIKRVNDELEKLTRMLNDKNAAVLKEKEDEISSLRERIQQLDLLKSSGILVNMPDGTASSVVLLPPSASSSAVLSTPTATISAPSGVVSVIDRVNTEPSAAMTASKGTVTTVPPYNVSPVLPSTVPRQTDTPPPPPLPATLTPLPAATTPTPPLPQKPAEQTAVVNASTASATATTSTAADNK